MTELLRAFVLLIKSGELGAADGRSLNILSPKLDQQGEIGRDELIALLFAGSKDPDGACRSFLSRLKAAAQQAAQQAEQRGEEQAAAMFRSITVARIKAKGGAARLRFSACAPKEFLPVTARANRDYLPENYQPSTGCNPMALPSLQQQQELSGEKPESEGCFLLKAGRKELYDYNEFIEVRGERAEIRTIGERHLTDEQFASYEALADFFDWLENSEASLYALLGDYGMGKTFTCRIFAQRLAERCENEPHLPKPVYLDLRDVPTFVTVNGKIRQPTLEEMLETVLRLNGQDEEYTAKELISAARQGKLICIFDGLDEKLVYYTADMRSQLLNELLRVFPQNGQAKVKIVISCRTHHFETITQMDGFLLGLNRSGLSGDDYRALHLLPFSAEQMLALLTKLLGADKAERIFVFIDSEAYLKDLARRPFILRQLSRLLPKLQELKNQGKPINSAGFYQALIEDCLTRDEEKNIIKPRHKQLLLADLAAEFWQSSTQLWQIDQLNDWFCAWLQKQPELAAQYSNVDSHLLEKDLRNSTLLVRFGEQDFGFSHSSMQEFFLSRYLLLQWKNNKDFHINHNISILTKQFLCDHLYFLNEKELEQLNQGLAITLARPWAVASDLALTIIDELAKHGRILPKLTKVNLRGAELQRRKFKGLHGDILYLDRTIAIETNWNNCHFQYIRIIESDISESVWNNCSWKQFETKKCKERFVENVTIVNCDGSLDLSKCHILPSIKQAVRQIDNDKFDNDGLYIISNFISDKLEKIDLEFKCNDTVMSCCFSPDGNYISASYDNYLKLFDADGRYINSFKGRQGVISGCCFSPDSRYIVLAADDKTLKVCNLKGECIQIIKGNSEVINHCCFSPTGIHILSASDDNTMKLWDLKGNCIQTFQGHKEGINSCCFSPNGDYILSASFDETLRLWNFKGECIQTFKGHKEGINSCCFSPNGNYILSAADDTTLKLWNLEGICIQSFQGHREGVNICFFSLDGRRIISAADDMALKIWELDGRCLQTFKEYEGNVLSYYVNSNDIFILSASEDGNLRLWSLNGVTERISAVWEEQWYTAFFRNNQLEKIIGTELSWKMANFAKDGKTWTLDQTGCFEWVPAQY